MRGLARTVPCCGSGTVRELTASLPSRPRCTAPKPSQSPPLAPGLAAGSEDHMLWMWSNWRAFFCSDRLTSVIHLWYDGGSAAAGKSWTHTSVLGFFGVNLALIVRDAFQCFSLFYFSCWGSWTHRLSVLGADILAFQLLFVMHDCSLP